MDGEVIAYDEALPLSERRADYYSTGETQVIHIKKL